MNARSRRAGWLYKNRDKGIPNLMLWIAIGNVIVYLLTSISTKGYLIPQSLMFSASAIAQGQIWRLITFVFTYLCETNPLLGAISLLCYYWFGKVLEQYWGTLRFNLYYLTGILLCDAVAMIVFLIMLFTGLPVFIETFSASAVNLSIFLAVATLQPEAQVRIWFVLPLKMKWAAWVSLGFSVYDVVSGIIAMIRLPFLIYLGWLIPIVAIGNYLIFFWKDVPQLFPDWMKTHHSHPKKVKTGNRASDYGKIIPVKSRDYRFRCTVCGRTDKTNPDLEFRYCSRCSGYRCYCLDHINAHAHILE